MIFSFVASSKIPERKLNFKSHQTIMGWSRYTFHQRDLHVKRPTNHTVRCGLEKVKQDKEEVRVKERDLHAKRPTNRTVRCGLEKVKQDRQEVRVKHACI